MLILSRCHRLPIHKPLESLHKMIQFARSVLFGLFCFATIDVRNVMTFSAATQTTLIALIEEHASNADATQTPIDALILGREDHASDNYHIIQEQGIFIPVQGCKQFTVGQQTFRVQAGEALAIFLPLLFEISVIGATPEKPLLGIGIRFDMSRIAEMLVKLETIERTALTGTERNSVGYVVETVDDAFLEPVIRLMRTLRDPAETAILAPSIIDEIYFRLLTGKHSGMLRELLHYRGRIQQIAPAVNHIHQHIHAPIAVPELAQMTNMSVPNFRKLFGQVLQLPPLQYAKSIKLDRARTLMQNGMSVAEAGRQVGYNSPAQFSREYKRQFGYAPSAETN